MVSPFGKDKTTKKIECYVQEKYPRPALNSSDLIHSFTGVTQLDEKNIQRMASPTSSVYSDARNSFTVLSCRNGCFGDSRAPSPSETSPKLEKDILVLGENILKQVFAKRNFTTDKIIHVDIAPDNDCFKNSDESSPKDLSQIHVIRASENKVSAENKSCEADLGINSSKEFYDARAKIPDTIPKRIGSEDTCVGERRVRWSPETIKLDYFRRNFEEGSSTESINQAVLKGFQNFNRRQNSPPETSPCIRRVDQLSISTEMVESFAQTDKPNEKSKDKSKFKMALLELFLSCVKCFM